MEAKTIVVIALVVFMLGAGIWLKTRKKNK
jgi:LPXTG-motif cell wall-anchored protein